MTTLPSLATMLEVLSAFVIHHSGLIPLEKSSVHVKLYDAMACMGKQIRRMENVTRHNVFLFILSTYPSFSFVYSGTQQVQISNQSLNMLI